MSRTALFLTTAAAAVAALAPPASAASKPPPARTVSMDLEVQRFEVHDGRVRARAIASTRVRTKDGKVRKQRKAVLVQARSGGNCLVLSLTLEDLQLKLLGLNLNASEINLRITGTRDRILGRLFCDLARARGITLSRLTRSINQELGGRPMRVLGLRSKLPADRRFAQQQQAQQPPQCQVLRLVLGPLDLDLLGLKVELYGGDRSKPVVVEVTATPNGGVLGSLFCQLANTGVTLRPPTS